MGFQTFHNTISGEGVVDLETLVDARYNVSLSQA
jgi:hypothetical protein